MIIGQDNKGGHGITLKKRLNRHKKQQIVERKKPLNFQLVE